MPLTWRILQTINAEVLPLAFLLLLFPPQMSQTHQLLQPPAMLALCSERGIAEARQPFCQWPKSLFGNIRDNFWYFWYCFPLFLQPISLCIGAETGFTCVAPCILGQSASMTYRKSCHPSIRNKPGWTAQKIKVILQRTAELHRSQRQAIA